MYWSSGNGMTRRSFAENGRPLAAFEWLWELEDIDIEPSVAAALEGLDGDERHWIGTGMVAVERFTGYQMTAADLERIEAADIAFRIEPEDTAPEDTADDQESADDQDPSE
jgi:hypothetical protein